MNKGDVVHKVWLDCGHMDLDVQKDASKKPMWMMYDIRVGYETKCPVCSKIVHVVKVKRLQGWGD